MIKYAIFDMDGTLFDTEEMFCRSWLETSKRYGLENATGVYEGVAGASADTAKKILRESYGDRIDPDAFFAERTQLTVDMFEREGIPVKSGCLELLEFLKGQGIPMAVGTSTPMYITEKNLRSAGVYDYFCDIVTSEMVENGKPAPDIFLEAGKRIGAVPSETIVCEDSTNGLRAAFAAGMKPIFIFDRQMPDGETLSHIYRRCETLADVIDVIREENKI